MTITTTTTTITIIIIKTMESEDLWTLKPPAQGAVDISIAACDAFYCMHTRTGHRASGTSKYNVHTYCNTYTWMALSQLSVHYVEVSLVSLSRQQWWLQYSTLCEIYFFSDISVVHIWCMVVHRNGAAPDSTLYDANGFSAQALETPCKMGPWWIIWKYVHCCFFQFPSFPHCKSSKELT